MKKLTLRVVLLALALTATVATFGAGLANAVVADCPGACNNGGGACCQDTSGVLWFGHRGT
jgi:hypothetical protein